MPVVYTRGMAAPRRPPRRTRVVVLRVTPRELTIWHAGAAAAGVALSELARGAVTDAARTRLAEEEADRARGVAS
jgi:hypothetical protein